jgi:hypothetical protein
MMTVVNSNSEGTLIVIPGLSRSLDTIGKHVVSFDETDGRLLAEVSSVVQRANGPEVQAQKFASAWSLLALVVRYAVIRSAGDAGCRGATVQGSDPQKAISLCPRSDHSTRAWIVHDRLKCRLRSSEMAVYDGLKYAADQVIRMQP